MIWALLIETDDPEFCANLNSRISDGVWFDATDFGDEHFYGLGGVYVLEGEYGELPLSLKMSFNKSKHIMTSADILFDSAQGYEIQKKSQLFKIIYAKSQGGRTIVPFEWRYHFTFDGSRWSTGLYKPLNANWWEQDIS